MSFHKKLLPSFSLPATSTTKLCRLEKCAYFPTWELNPARDYHDQIYRCARGLRVVWHIVVWKAWMDGCMLRRSFWLQPGAHRSHVLGNTLPLDSNTLPPP
ncbi:hypothetical protein ILYODFUR_002416 [Ilyodon furcidens]|uniref:Uncharacterized protein n=1 Tax=Ilyodon furcidens TaxID=33524 RepID=A0ABV0U3X6_9TELE